MQEMLMQQEDKRAAAATAVQKALARIIDEQLDWYRKLQYEIGRPQLPRWASWLIALVLANVAALLLDWLALPEVADVILRVVVCAAGLLLIFCVPRKRRASDWLFWADDLQRMPLFASMCMQEVRLKLQEGDAEATVQILLGVLEAREGFEPRPVDTPWQHAARHPEQVEAFQRLVHLLGGVQQRAGVLTEAVDVERLEIITEQGLGASRYPLEKLYAQLDEILTEESE